MLWPLSNVCVVDDGRFLAICAQKCASKPRFSLASSHQNSRTFRARTPKMATRTEKTEKTGGKKRSTESDNESESDSSEDDDVGGIKLLSENNDSEKLEVLFEFRDPDTTYYSPIGSLLAHFPCTSGIDSSDLSDTIANQPEVGTLVCQEEGLDVFALITALNLGPHRVCLFA
jgi:hypothetical protein